MKRIGIFGASECGKSTLARAISRETWRKQGRPSLVLLEFPENWGRHAWTTTDPETFRDVVFGKRTDCLVIVEDASSTINRDADFKKFFTCIRHQRHDFIVIGHDGTDLLPTMRRNLTELFLFYQSEQAIQVWQRDLPAIKGLEAAATLNRYEFLHAKNFETAKLMKLKL